jgi:peroxiredoxin
VLLVFYLGDECLHCMEQITGLNERLEEFAKEDTVVVAVSKDSPEKIAGYEEEGKIRVKLLSDPGFENARRFHAFDDFEEIELHATVLVDKDRRVHWARTGGAPFMDFDYLMTEARRLNSGLVHRLRRPVTLPDAEGSSESR